MNKRDGMIGAGLLALAAIGMVGMGPSLTIEALGGSRPRTRRSGWVLDWQDDSVGGVMAFADGFEINAYEDGTFFVSVNDSGGRIVHEGKAKNPRLTTAMNAAEKWWAANKEQLLEVKP